MQRGLAVLEQVQPTFAAAEIELDVRVTQRPGHAREMVRTLDLTNVDGLYAIGGDGTVHEVADGLMQRGKPIAVPLGIIPAGTGNTLVQHLQCNDPLLGEFFRATVVRKKLLTADEAERAILAFRVAMPVVSVQLPGEANVPSQFTGSTKLAIGIR